MSFQFEEGARVSQMNRRILDLQGMVAEWYNPLPTSMSRKFFILFQYNSTFSTPIYFTEER